VKASLECRRLECGKNGSQISRKDHITVKLSSNLLRNIKEYLQQWGVSAAAGWGVPQRVGVKERIAASMTRSFSLAADSGCWRRGVIRIIEGKARSQPASVTVVRSRLYELPHLAEKAAFHEGFQLTGSCQSKELCDAGLVSALSAG
jgi:hypothetical protein